MRVARTTDIARAGAKVYVVPTMAQADRVVTMLPDYNSAAADMLVREVSSPYEADFKIYIDPTTSGLWVGGSSYGGDLPGWKKAIIWPLWWLMFFIGAFGIMGVIALVASIIMLLSGKSNNLPDNIASAFFFTALLLGSAYGIYRFLKWFGGE